MCIPHREVGDEEVELDHASATTLHLCGEWVNLRKVLEGRVARHGMVNCTCTPVSSLAGEIGKYFPEYPTSFNQMDNVHLRIASASAGGEEFVRAGLSTDSQSE